MANKRRPRKKDHWIVARTHPKKEHWAAQNVENQGYQTKIFEYYDHDRRRRQVLFPGFIFIKTPGPWYFLNGTRGVRGPLMTGDQPSKMPQRLMDEIVQREKDGLVQLPRSSQFEKGMRVRVRYGTFGGLEALYQKQHSQHRSQILVELLGRQAQIEVDTRTLETV